MTPEEWIAYAARALEREQRRHPEPDTDEQILEALAFLDEVLDD